MREVVIVGAGHSRVGRDLGLSAEELTEQAIQAALDDCGLPANAIDGLATYPSAPYGGVALREGVHHASIETVLSILGSTSEVRWYADLSKGMTGSSVIEATHALAFGACRYALVWRTLTRPTGTYGEWAGATAAGEDQFTAPYGCHPLLQWHALQYQRYLLAAGGDRERLGALAVSSRANAQLNEHAYLRGRPLTDADYRAARMVADPLCLLDCDVPVEGSGALVLTTLDRAADLRRRPVVVAGAAQNTTPRRAGLHYMLDDPVEAGRRTADRLWEAAMLGPADMDMAQLYDGFGPTVLYWLEALGFCGRGEALDFIQDGRIARSGALPVNTFGGSLSEGRLHGIGHLVEAVRQLQGEAGERQLAAASSAVVTTGSPLLRGAGLVLLGS